MLLLSILQSVSPRWLNTPSKYKISEIWAVAVGSQKWKSCNRHSVLRLHFFYHTLSFQNWTEYLEQLLILPFEALTFRRIEILAQRANKGNLETQYWVLLVLPINARNMPGHRYLDGWIQYKPLRHTWRCLWVCRYQSVSKLTYLFLINSLPLPQGLTLSLATALHHFLQTE